VRRLSPVREAWLALAGWTLVAAVSTWPTLRHPASTIPADLGDPLLQAWQLAWGGHALSTQPLHPFDSNTFYPLPGSLAFSDSLLGYAPAGWVGSGPAAALVRYNLVFVFSYALCGWGAYLLARQLGLRRCAALVAGAVMAAVPWRAAQAGHLNILSCGAIPLALALLARGHGLGRGGARPVSLAAARPPLALLGWLVAAWQLSLGFGVGLQWGYLLGVVIVGGLVLWLRAGRPTVPRRLVLADALGGALFLLIAGLFALPYLTAVRDHPEAERTVADLELFSPPPWGFLAAPDTNVAWGQRQAGVRAGLSFPPEMALALGGVAVALTVLGVVAARGWTRRRRVVLAGALITLLVLATGVRGPLGGRLYLLLFHYGPGFSGVRTPGRLVVSATVVLALLAAAGAQAAVDGLGRAVGAERVVGVGRDRSPAQLAAALVVPGLGVVLALLVLGEGADNLAHPRPPAPPTRALRTGSGPLLVLPTDEGSDEFTMWWTTDGFPAVANGGSGFVPELTRQLRVDAAAFPAEPAVVALRGYGLRRVLVLLSRYDASSRQLLRTTALPAGVARVELPEEDALVFTL